jgi:hypothetical protein
MSKPQLLAVLSRVEDAAAEYGLSKQNSAGSSQWEVLDFGSIVVQVFTADQRDVFDLDSFYSLADEVYLPFLTESGSGSTGVQQQVAAAFDAAGSSSAAAASWSTSQ